MSSSNKNNVLQKERGNRGYPTRFLKNGWGISGDMLVFAWIHWRIFEDIEDLSLVFERNTTVVDGKIPIEATQGTHIAGPHSTAKRLSFRAQGREKNHPCH